MREISADDYVAEVNKAGEGIYVILHLYKQGIPLCALINQYLTVLAMKNPTVKFLKAISTTCIPNYPDRNLPTIFVYHEGKMEAQLGKQKEKITDVLVLFLNNLSEEKKIFFSLSLAGPQHFRGMNMTAEEFEYLLGKTGAIKTEITSDPRPQVKDVMMSALGTVSKNLFK